MFLPLETGRKDLGNQQDFCLKGLILVLHTGKRMQTERGILVAPCCMCNLCRDALSLAESFPKTCIIACAKQNAFSDFLCQFLSVGDVLFYKTTWFVGESVSLIELQ